jgi:hypothetical protein
MVIRYPVFVFDGDDTVAYHTQEEHWDSLESYGVDYPEILYDRDGRPLVKSDAGGDRMAISLADAEPDPGGLRKLLLEALRRSGQTWADDATLDALADAAAAEFAYSARGVSIREIFSPVLRFFGLRRGPS